MHSKTHGKFLSHSGLRSETKFQTDEQTNSKYETNENINKRGCLKIVFVLSNSQTQLSVFCLECSKADAERCGPLEMFLNCI